MAAAPSPRAAGEDHAGPRHFLDLKGIDGDRARALLDRAVALKEGRLEPGWTPPLLGRSLGLVFEKPSLRTRVSFETAFARLGGSSIFLRGKDVGMGVRESVADFARVISQYVDALAVRTFAHATLEELAEYATVPVVNALSDDAHPCQAMADMLTLLELKGSLPGIKLGFVGDGNNVAMSLAEAAALLGVDFVLACPEGYEYPEAFTAAYAARFPDAPLRVSNDPRDAADGADALYTDVWASMGQEHEADQRREIFSPFQVDEELMAAAKPDAVFLHCLPAHRGEEVASNVLDGPRSRVFQQAANRMYFQMALLEWLVRDRSAADRLRV
ncbi:ornithine carbamoyltransferase [Planctomyces sp. SH-PL62]|uniref:ornithine carbamoyltransferase n=1 Tax=Planctomyces sp. SH-PL62 TaxID=1636152 RepID=UPI00078C8A7B|nr:ornithine carbamoyltransferase [Planctomyces sp. SH-PL62]AMV39782.1 Ornithine carbamoyltransferase [Planctomyces sp. SH-PL62]